MKVILLLIILNQPIHPIDFASLEDCNIALTKIREEFDIRNVNGVCLKYREPFK